MNLVETQSAISNVNTTKDSSLLDFSCPPETTSSVDSALLQDHHQTNNSEIKSPPQSDMDILNDIFCSIENTVKSPVTLDSNFSLPNVDVMQPIQVITSKLPGTILMRLSRNVFINFIFLSC